MSRRSKPSTCVHALGSNSSETVIPAFLRARLSCAGPSGPDGSPALVPRRWPSWPSCGSGERPLSGCVRDAEDEGSVVVTKVFSAAGGVDRRVHHWARPQPGAAARCRRRPAVRVVFRRRYTQPALLRLPALAGQRGGLRCCRRTGRGGHRRAEDLQRFGWLGRRRAAPDCSAVRAVSSTAARAAGQLRCAGLHQHRDRGRGRCGPHGSRPARTWP